MHGAFNIVLILNVCIIYKAAKIIRWTIFKWQNTITKRPKKILRKFWHTHTIFITVELILTDRHKGCVCVYISVGQGIPNSIIYQSIVATWKRYQILRFFNRYWEIWILCEFLWISFFFSFLFKQCVGKTRASHFENSDLIPLTSFLRLNSRE